MDLGISGRKAILCASSKGLGLACAISLSREGVHVVLNGRDEARLVEAAAQLRRLTNGTVAYVAADINTEDGRARLVAACPDADILVNNNEGPQPGDWLNWGHAEWMVAIEANMLAPIMMMKALIPGMRARKFGRVVNITSAMVKAPRPHMSLSTSARAGLTAFSKAISLDVARDNVTINNMLPERIDTGRQQFMAKRLMEREGITLEEARQRFADSIAAKRMGKPEEFGDACAYLCSAQASFISGQNVQLDGGSYPGVI